MEVDAASDDDDDDDGSGNEDNEMSGQINPEQAKANVKFKLLSLMQVCASLWLISLIKN